MKKIVLGVVLGGVFFLTNQALACVTFSSYTPVSYTETTLLTFAVFALLLGLLIGLLAGRKTASCCKKTDKKGKK